LLRRKDEDENRGDEYGSAEIFSSPSEAVFELLDHRFSSADEIAALIRFVFQLARTNEPIERR